MSLPLPVSDGWSLLAGCETRAEVVAQLPAGEDSIEMYARMLKVEAA